MATCARGLAGSGNSWIEEKIAAEIDQSLILDGVWSGASIVLLDRVEVRQRTDALRLCGLGQESKQRAGGCKCAHRHDCPCDIHMTTPFNVFPSRLCQVDGFGWDALDFVCRVR